MYFFDRTEASGIYEQILRHKFGALYDWRKPEFAETVGPYFPDAFDAFALSLESILRECFAILKGYPEDSLPKLNVPV